MPSEETYLKLLQEINASLSTVSERSIRQEEQLNNTNKRLDKIESTMTWIMRTVGGLIIVAIMGLILI